MNTRHHRLRYRKSRISRKNIVAPTKVEKHPVVIQDTWQQIGQQIANKDQTDNNSIPAAPLTIHHDQLGKQTVNTIREVPENIYKIRKNLFRPKINFPFLENTFQNKKK